MSDLFTDSEIVIGLVGAVGTNLRNIASLIKDRLRIYDYACDVINISSDVIAKLIPNPVETSNEYERISKYMDLGDQIRKESRTNAALALGAVAKISSMRSEEEGEPKPSKRKAYIIKSLKHQDEVAKLRYTYGSGFYLFGIYGDENNRLDFLVNTKNMREEDAKDLIKRDEDESITVGKHGQQTRSTFQLSDFFINDEHDIQKLRNSLHRILDILLGHPFKTPTFDEYAMFIAYTTSLRSADLSRQIGAVIANNNEIISSGVNDCPKSGGGLYWPEYDVDEKCYIDQTDGRDYMLGYDSNKIEQLSIIKSILESLDMEVSTENINIVKNSKIRHLTEYGRVVHAEMEAILMAARNNISCRNATLYCTTFPCHNCAKHIIASGIKKVIYIEPYPKSKAFDFYKDAIDHNNNNNKVEFTPFIGIGPRRYIQMFAMTSGYGYDKIRKNKEGYKVEWDVSKAFLLEQMFPNSYLKRELMARAVYNKISGKA